MSKVAYKIYKKLGQGGYGEVFLGKDNIGNQVVVKKIPIREDNKEKAMNEVRIMRKIKHNNVIHFIDSFINKSNLIIVMDYAQGGDLSKFLKRRMGDLLTEDLVWNIFLQITFGLRYLHSINILHRDLKTQNIFLTSDGTAKIGDFGIGRILVGDDIAKTFVGTPCYLSPEMCEEKPYDFKSDMWSLGCILYELCTLTKPFTGSNMAEVMRRIRTSEPKRISSMYSAAIARIVMNLLDKDPKKRMTADEICKMQYVQNVINDMFDYNGVTTILFKEIQQKQDMYNKEEGSSGSSSREELTQKILEVCPEYESDTLLIGALNRLGKELRIYDNYGKLEEVKRELDTILEALRHRLGNDLWLNYGMLSANRDKLPHFFKHNKLTVKHLDLILDAVRLTIRKSRIEDRILKEKSKKENAAYEKSKKEVEDAMKIRDEEKQEEKKEERKESKGTVINPRFEPDVVSNRRFN